MTRTAEVTKTDNGDGTFRYEHDGVVLMKASRVDYAAATLWATGSGNAATSFHKTAAAAERATQCPGNKYLNVKLGVVVF